MLENCEHHHMIEMTIRKGKWRTQISAHPLPASLGVIRHLIIEADAHGDPVRRVIEEGSFQTATEIADSRTWTNMRIGRAKTHPGDEMIDPGVGHSALFPLV